MSGTLQREFINRRVRLQRVHDGRFFSGWVKSSKASHVTIGGIGSHDIEPNQQFALEVYGTQRTAFFYGEVTLCQGRTLTLAVTSEIKCVSPTNEDARLQVAEREITITWEGESMRAWLVDVSLNGAGFYAECELMRGDMLQLEVPTPGGRALLEGTVRYCRPAADRNGMFRVGVRLEARDRLQSAKWTAILNDPDELTA